MKKIVLVTILSFLSITGWAAGSPQWEKYSINFPARGDVAHSVTFSYVGKRYLSPGKSQLAPLEKKGRSLLDKEELFILNIVTRNAAGDAAGILEMWPASERQQIALSMKSSNALEKNSAFFRNIESTRLILVLRYSSFFLFVVEHQVSGIGKFMKLYPALSDGGAYLMTNALQGDLFYEKVIPDMLNALSSPVAKRKSD